MFKYTPPWQVLCHSLEQDIKRQATFASSINQDAHKPRTEQTLSHLNKSAALADPLPAEDHSSSSNIMGSNPKRWVMKPLIPRLEKSDLRAMLSPGSEPLSPDNSWSEGQDGFSPTFSFDNISVSRTHSSVTVSAPVGDHAQDVVVHARQVAVTEDGSEDWILSNPSSPGSLSSTDSHVGFYSFVDDPTSLEAEKNEAYMVSPERQAKLSTLKEKSSFKLQTYVEDRRPEKLFEENNGDSCYMVEDVSMEEEETQKLERLEIIRSQAPKKNPVLKEQWSALENLDLSNPPQRLVEGFSLCYSPVSTKNPQAEIEPGTIDDQQIDFNAVRKQFQMMENSKQNPFQHSPQHVPHFSKLRVRSLPAEIGLFTKDVSQNENLKDEPGQIQIRKEKETKMTVTVFEDPENSLLDDLDSGLDEQRAGYTNDGSLSSEPSLSEMGNSSSVTSMSETPIEKEIRIAREREEDLRKSRGIFRTDSSEMVEIKTKPILSQPSKQLKPIKAKETNRVSFLIQREMNWVKQTQGVDNQETLSDLSEKSRTSRSQSDEVPIRSVTVEDTWIAERPALVEESDVPDSQETLSPCCPHRHKDEAMIQILDRRLRPSFYTRGGAAERQSDDRPTNQPAWTAPYKVKESWRTISPINFPSSPVEPVQSSKSVPRRSYWEGSGEWPRMQNTSDVIRKEIEEDLRREQELQELRETSILSFTTDTVTPEHTASEPTSNENDQTFLNSSQENLVEVDAVLPEKSTQGSSYSLSYSQSEDYTPTHISLAGLTSRLPSVSIMTAQPWSSPKPASPAIPKATPNLLVSPLPEASATPSHKGLAETLLEDFEERRVKQKLEESSYAGIQPIDDINNEVVEATRVTRHKNTRALRWEAGMYANEDNN